MGKKLEVSQADQRQANLKAMFDELRKRDMTVADVSQLLNIGDSGARNYLYVGLQRGALEVIPVEAFRYTHRILNTYRLVNEDAAREMCETPKHERYVPFKTVDSVSKRRIAKAATEGRRIVHKGDDAEYLRLPPMKPAFRCEFESIFFGPAKVTA